LGWPQWAYKQIKDALLGQVPCAFKDLLTLFFPSLVHGNAGQISDD
jgi:hypothetical protein